VLPKAEPDKSNYRVGIRWRNGETREIQFMIDDAKLAELHAVKPDAITREALVLDMVACAIEGLFQRREEERRQRDTSKEPFFRKTYGEDRK